MCSCLPGAPAPGDREDWEGGLEGGKGGSTLPPLVKIDLARRHRLILIPFELFLNPGCFVFQNLLESLKNLTTTESYDLLDEKSRVKTWPKPGYMGENPIDFGVLDPLRISGFFEDS